MLNLSEIFYSIQGEGPLMGRPAVFIRFSGCNLRCEWNGSKCDTPYTSWDAETNPKSCDEIVASIEPLLKKTKLIVITGGEPALQVELVELTAALAALGCELQIETNGTGPIPQEIDTIVCSPKLSDSTPSDAQWSVQHERQRLKLHPSISGSDPRLYLKFVISRRSDFTELLDVVHTVGVDPQRVYLMAEGSTARAHDELAPIVADIALENGFCYSSRLHLLLWGNERGR